MIDQPTHYHPKCAHCRRETPHEVPIGVQGTFFCNDACHGPWRRHNNPPIAKEPKPFKGEN